MQTAGQNRRRASERTCTVYTVVAEDPRSEMGDSVYRFRTRREAEGCAKGRMLWGSPATVDEDHEVPVLQTSPEAPTPCVNCGSTACEWPGECAPRASECSRAAGHLALEVACSHIGPNTAAVLREYVAQLERAVDRLVVK